MRCKERKKDIWEPNSRKVLVLNQAYMPMEVISWEQAVADLCIGNSEIIDYYDDILLHSGYDRDGNHRVIMQCPSVIRNIKAPVSKSIMVKTLPMTKRNILERDKFKCCYCDKSLNLETMTKDHVYPISRGGLDDWCNVRASCVSCNNTKDSYTLSELGWTLKRRVGIPTLDKAAPKGVIRKLGGRIPHESWRPYIFWEVKTSEKIRE